MEEKGRRGSVMVLRRREGGKGSECNGTATAREGGR